MKPKSDEVVLQALVKYKLQNTKKLPCGHFTADEVAEFMREAFFFGMERQRRLKLIEEGKDENNP